MWTKFEDWYLYRKGWLYVLIAGGITSLSIGYLLYGFRRGQMFLVAFYILQAAFTLVGAITAWCRLNKK